MVRAIGGDACIDDRLVAIIVGQGRLDRFEWHAVVVGDLRNVAVNRREMPDQCPDGNPIVFEPRLIQSRPVWIELDVPANKVRFSARCHRWLPLT